MKFLQVQAMVNPNTCYHSNKFSRHNVTISKNVRSKKVKIDFMIISGCSITMKQLLYQELGLSLSRCVYLKYSFDLRRCSAEIQCQQVFRNILYNFLPTECFFTIFSNIYLTAKLQWLLKYKHLKQARSLPPPVQIGIIVDRKSDY